MSGLFFGELPPVIIMEPPGTLATSRRRHKCMVCAELFHISETSGGTIRDLRRAHQLYLVCCYGCSKDLLPLLNATGFVQANQHSARSALGLR